MNPEVFNLELRKFLKQFGVTAQREIEKAVAAAIASGKLKGNETLQARARIEIGSIALSAVVEGDIKLA
jgi:hypothetical protein